MRRFATPSPASSAAAAPISAYCAPSSVRQTRKENTMTLKMNRREFLAGTGALTVSVLLPGLTTHAAVAAGTQATRLGLKPDQLSSYISVNQDGSVVGWVGKVDMAQGTEIGW